MGAQQANAFKTMPPIRKNCEEFYTKKEKNGFSDRNQDWDKQAFFFLWGNLSHQNWSQEMFMMVVFWVIAHNNSTCEKGISSEIRTN